MLQLTRVGFLATIPIMRSSTALVHLFLFILLSSNPANAQESGWQKTFVPAAVGSYLPTGKNDIMVAAAGEVGRTTRNGADSKSAVAIQEDRTSAAKALETALRLSGRAGLVMNAEGLGALAGLDDAQIVKKAAGMPIMRVAILRLFPAGPNQPLRAVVTLYDKAGSVLSAFSAIAGSPLEQAEGHQVSHPGEGITTRAADNVAEHVATYKADNEKSRATYDQNFIGFDDWAAVTQTGNVVRTWTQPWRGKYKTPLEGPDFYRALGRADLAAKYQANRSRKVGFTVVGGVVAGVGMLVAVTGMGRTPDYSSSNEADWKSTTNSTQMILGLGLMAVGGAMATIPWVTSSHPVDPPEARRLADEHNQKLKAKLGLTLDEEDSSPRHGARSMSALTVAPVPFAYPQGGGLALVGRY